MSFEQIALEINGDNSYGYVPLKEAIADYHEIDPECVVTAAGTSMANYLAFAALLDPATRWSGASHVRALADALRYIGAKLVPFEREEQAGWAVDPAAVRQRDHAEDQADRALQPQSEQCADAGARTARDQRHRA